MQSVHREELACGRISERYWRALSLISRVNDRSMEENKYAVIEWVMRRSDYGKVVECQRIGISGSYK